MDGPVPIALSDAGVATPLHSRCFTAAFWKTRRWRDSFLPENGRVPTGQTAAVYSIAVFSGPATYSAIFASWKVGKKMSSLSLSLFLSRFSARIRGDIAAGPLVRINEIVRAVIKLPRFLMFFGEFCYREVNFFDWTDLDCKLFHYLFEIF